MQRCSNVPVFWERCTRALLLAIASLIVSSCTPEGVEGSVPLPEDAPLVVLETSMGRIVIGLYEEHAPVTATNFLGYVNSEFYDGTLFHRVIPNFMIQGGGFVRDGGGPLTGKPTRPPIVSESDNGLKNLRGTLTMARGGDPDSATAQFFINLVDNQRLDRFGQVNPGYAVFGLVVEGMDVVDAIAAVDTHSEPPVHPPGEVPVPDEDVVIHSVRRLR